MAYMTHEEAMDEAERLSEGIPWHHVRRVASRDLEKDWPEGEGLGSSDVSCHIACMVRCGELEDAIRPLRLLADAAKRADMPFEEMYEKAKVMFAPAN